MKKFINSKILLIAVLIIAGLLRIWQLGNVPISPNWDEVSLGYNAYSILQTGKDEYGEFLPVVLRSYDDYKPALYAYFAIPTVGLFGLTPFAVRLPSAIMGMVAVLLTYLLVKEILRDKKITFAGYEIISDYLAITSAFVMAISPWHIQFSRIAFESNIGLTINLAVFYLFLRGLKKPWLIVIAFAVGALNMHMYQSDRVFTPLLLIILTVIFYKRILQMKKWFVYGVLVAFIVFLPLLFYMISNQNALMRAKGVSVFSSQELVRRTSEKLIFDREIGYGLGLLFDNRRVEFVKASVAGYISHFDLNWLFVTGDIARHHAPDMGLLYLFEFPFLLLGIYLFAFSSINRKFKIAFFAYFLLAPLPASITSGVPHAVRTLNFLPTWQVFIAFGIVGACYYLMRLGNGRHKIISGGIAVFYGLFIVANFLYYLNQYFVQQNYFHAKDWLYGYKEAVEFVKPIQYRYDKIVVSNLAPLDQSYMFFLFYLKVDPAYYQQSGGTASGGFREKHRGFYNFTFQPVEEAQKMDGKVLIIARPQDNIPKSKILHTINFPNGDTAIQIEEK